MRAPTVARDIAALRIALAPREDLRATIAERAMRPVQFEIAAAPNRDALNPRQVERAIDPPAARPMRRPPIPIGMIVEDDDVGRFGLREKGRGQMMKIARAEKDERRQTIRDAFGELAHRSARCKAPQPRSPRARVEARQSLRGRLPRGVEI